MRSGGVIWCIAVGFLWTSPVRAQDAQELGGPGESCRARTDCKAHLKCLANVCVDEHEGMSCTATSDCGLLKCIANRCINPVAAPVGSALPPPPPPLPTLVPPVPVPVPTAPPKAAVEDTRPSLALQEWLHFRPSGARPFIGVTIAGGFVNGGYTGGRAAWGSGVDGAFLFALRGGVLIAGRHELGIEVSPFTYLWDTQAPGPAFQVNGTYGYLVPLLQGESAQLYWPLRVGAGTVIGGSNTGNNVFFQARADAIGLTLKVGHLLFEAHLPSFRYALTNARFAGFGDGVTQHVLSWFVGTTIGYVF